MLARIVLALAAASLTACATHGPALLHDPFYTDAAMDSSAKAQVLSVDPIYSDESQRTRVSVCANPNTSTGGVIGASQPPQSGCHATDQFRVDRDIVGYRVYYTYAGATYRTRLSYRPGSTINVNVAVTPISQ